VQVVIEHWGYSPKSGAGLVTLAAVKHFGLIEDQGRGVNRTVKLSDLALKIILSPDPSEQGASLKAAALTPAIHRELWDKYGADLPSHAILRYELLQRGFSESGAEELIQEYRQTIQVAGLSASDKLPEENEDQRREDGVEDMSKLVKAPEAFLPLPDDKTRKPLVLNLPLSRRSLAVIQVPQTVTPDEWDRLIAALETFKGAIVAEPEEPSEPEGPSQGG
jgi:hypothetical protein